MLLWKDVNLANLIKIAKSSCLNPSQHLCLYGISVVVTDQKWYFNLGGRGDKVVVSCK